MGRVACGALVFVFACFFTILSTVVSDKEETELFDSYIHHYNKSYEVGSAEYYEKFGNFKESLRRHAYLNDGRTNVKYGVNKFSDMSHSEFKATYLSGSRRNVSSTLRLGVSGSSSSAVLPSANLPPKWDWRDRGVVSSVKDQKHCGGCWAFSAVETVESAYAIQWNLSSAPILSVQQVIDCSTNNAGCNGGNVAPAYDWLIQSMTTLVEDSQYPVTDKPEYCSFFPPSSKGVLLTAYSCYNFVGAEDVLRQHLYSYGPLSVAVDATTWNDYLGGIIQWHCTDSINHEVQLVGYDVTGPVPYYIARNSWGSDWGNGGYVYIKTDADVCGVAGTVCEVLGTKPAG